MNKNITPAKPAHLVSASDQREIILKATADAGLPFKAVTGRTFPIRRVLWTNGGRWNKEANVWEVPAQRYTDMQKLADEVTAKVEASMAKSAARKALAASKVNAAQEAPAV